MENNKEDNKEEELDYITIDENITITGNESVLDLSFIMANIKSNIDKIYNIYFVGVSNIHERMFIHELLSIEELKINNLIMKNYYISYVVDFYEKLQKIKQINNWDLSENDLDIESIEILKMCDYITI